MYIVLLDGGDGPLVGVEAGHRHVIVYGPLPGLLLPDPRTAAALPHQAPLP